jgi:rhamnose utilization protein RhaD (predicted bifunctional aldolase and dehydrogenase)
MRPSGLAALDQLSATLGHDVEQVQAAGGNTSLKVDGVLWVKASGLWLADALKRDIFVPVRLQPVLDAVAADAADPVAGAVAQELNPGGLRPSIETTLHALLPHPVVIHTHSVRGIALAIRADAEAVLAGRLQGLVWTFVPYCQPGVPLTRRVAALQAERPADVLVLGNHGIVVGGETVESAAALLEAVERRLDAPARHLGDGPAPALDATARRTGLRPAAHTRAHGLAMDRRGIEIAAGGSLYPDHVIFLGPGIAVLAADGDVGESIEQALALGRKLFVVPGEGVLLAADTTRSADELALCQALVLERLPLSASVRYLTSENEAALLDWDAEKYRQSLAKARAGG